VVQRYTFPRYKRLFNFRGTKIYISVVQRRKAVRVRREDLTRAWRSGLNASLTYCRELLTSPTPSEASSVHQTAGVHVQNHTYMDARITIQCEQEQSSRARPRHQVGQRIDHEPANGHTFTTQSGSFHGEVRLATQPTARPTTHWVIMMIVLCDKD
jgi:hypothetical protein